jgi:hypothetical protein
VIAEVFLGEVEKPGLQRVKEREFHPVQQLLVTAAPHGHYATRSILIPVEA